MHIYAILVITNYEFMLRLWIANACTLRSNRSTQEKPAPNVPSGKRIGNFGNHSWGEDSSPVWSPQSAAMLRATEVISANGSLMVAYW